MARKGDHEEVDALLPWFVNGSLADRDARRVMAHLRGCAACRRERDRLQAVQQVIIDAGDSGVPDYRFSFRKLMKRIDMHEANLESVRDVKPEPALWRVTPYVAAAACFVAVVAFVIALNPLAPAGDTPNGQYRTLTTSPDPGVRSAETSRRFALTFEQPAPSAVVRAALIESRSSIVAGPDAEGTYIVEIEVPDSVSPRVFIESLRDIEGVRYAALQSDTGDPSQQ